MSKTIDERVVSMQFDNKNFEKNASESMSTLDKLKSKLDFSGSAKAMKELDSSVKSCDMSPLASAAEAVKNKFSILEQIGIGALRRIGDQAVATGEKLIKSLTTDNLAEGWDKFGKKTNAVSTLVSQGYELETVNEQMEKLNWFTDETSYNFTAMASEIGKFTASGQGLEDSVTAMMGIANWAALSGQNATKASSAMYQLSQAMSKGALKYDDWKSIQNAGMDTKEVRQGFIDAAIALGQVRKEGDDAYKVVTELEDGTISLSRAFTFNEMFTSDAMSKHAWIDTDAMMSVFSKYGQAVQTLKTITDNEVYGLETASEAMQYLEDKAQEMVDEANAAGEELSMGDALKKVSMDAVMTIDSVASEVNEYYDSLSDIEKASFTTEKALEALGYGFDDFGLKALRSAQEARTWEDVIDATKDAVSTGWMNTFEQIFGDYEEAKTLWTRLANDFYDIFASAGEERNEVLSIWKEMGGRDLLFSTDEEHLGAIERILQSIKNIMSVITEASNEIFHAFEPLKTGLSGMPSEVIAVADAIGQVSDESSVAKDKAKGLYKITQAIAGAVKKVTDFFKEGSENLDKLKRTFKGIFAVVDIVKIAVGELFSAIGSIISALTGDANGGILDLTANVGDSIVAFRDWIKESGIFKKVFGTVGKVIVNAVNWIKQFIAWIRDLPIVQNSIAAIKTAFTELGNIVSSIFKKIEGGASIGDVFKEFTENNKIVENVKNFFKGIWDAITGFFSSFKDIPQQFTAGFSFFADSFGWLIDVFKGFINSLGIGGETIGEIFESIKNVFANFTISDYAMIALGVAIFLFVKKIFGAAKIAGEVVESFDRLSKAISGFFGGIKKALKSQAVLVLAASIMVLVGALVMIAQQDESKMWSALGILGSLVGIITIMFFVIGAVGNRLGTAALAVASLSVAVALLGGALAIMSKVNLSGAKNAAFILGSLATWFVVIGVIASRLVSDRKILQSMVGLAIMLVGVGASMILIAKAMKDMAQMDVSAMEKVGKMMISVAKALALVVAAASLVRKGAGSTILSTVVSLYLIIGAIKIFARLDPKTVTKGLYSVQEIFDVYARTLAIISAASLGRGTKGVGAAILALTVSLYGIMGAVVILGLIPTDMIERGIGAIQGIMLVMSVVLVAAGIAARLASRAKSAEGDAKDADDSISKLGTLLLKLAAALLGVTAALTILAVVAHFNPEGITQAAIVIGALMLLMALIVGISGLAKDSVKSLSAINVAIIALSVAVGSLAIISAMTGFENVLASAAGIAAVLALLVAGVILLSKMGDWAGGALATLAILTVITGVLAFILYNMKDMDPATSIGNAAALAILLGAMTVVLLASIVIGKFAEQATAAIVPIIEFIVIFGLVLGLAGGLFSTYSELKGVFENGVEFMRLLGEGIGAFFGGIVGGFTKGVSIAQADAAAKAMTTLYESTSTITDIDRLQQLVDMSNILSGMGANLGSVGDTEKMAEVFTEIAGFAPKLGDIAKEFSALEVNTENVSTVVSVGEMIAGLAKALPPHDGIAQWLGGDNTLQKFGIDMCEYAKYVVKFTETLGNVYVNEAKVNAVVNAGRMMAGLAKALPAHDGIAQWLGGDNTLSAFARDMVGYASNLKIFCDNLSTVYVNESKVDAVVNAGRMMAGLAKALPAHDGVAQWLGGDNTLGQFAKDMVAYSACIKPVVENLNGVTVDDATVDSVTQMGFMFSGLANTLPETGSVFDFLTGRKQTLTEFALHLKNLGIGVKDFSDAITEGDGIDEDAVTVATTALEVLSAVENNLPETTGIFGWLTGGDKDLDGFIEQMPKLAEGVWAFSNTLTSNGGIDPASVSAAAETLSALAEMSNIVGLPDFTVITSQLVPIAQNFKDYITTLDGENFSTKPIEDMKTSVLALVDLEKGLSKMTFVKVDTAFTKISDLIYMLNRVSMLDSEKITAFADVLTNFGQNGISEFLTAMQNESTAVEKTANTVLMSFVDGVQNNTNLFSAAFNKICDAGLEAVRSRKQEFTDAGAEIADGLSSGINSKIQTEGTESSGSSFDMFGGLFGNLDISSMTSQFTGEGGFLSNMSGALTSSESMTELGNMGTDMFGNMFNGLDIGSMTSQLTGEDGLLGKMSSALSGTESMDMLSGMGSDMFGGLLSGFDMSSVTDHVSGNDGILSTFSNAFSSTESVEMLQSTGGNATQGFIDGALGKELEVKDAGIKIAKTYKEGIENELKIASPSKETYRLGSFAGEGFLNALKEYISKSYESGEMLSDSTMEGMKAALNTAMASFNNDVDSQPTIKPVIDLTDVTAGADAINEVFGPDSTIGLTGNVNAIAGDFSNTSTITVDNSDIIKELSTLRNDMGVMADKLSKFQIYLDTGALVGSLADPMDSALGTKAAIRKRG